MRKEKLFVYAMVASILLMIVLTLALTASAAEAMVVWTDHATVKIRPKSPAKADQTSAILKAAKNEFESFQLIVTASAGPLSGVDVTVSDLTDAHGNVISGGSIMIYKEAFINVGTPSTIQGATGEWPDALIPKKDEYVGETRNAFPFSVGAGRNQPVWIEVYVPQTAASGKYTGTATVTATGQSPVAVPIELTVWNFQLPSTSTLKSAYSIDYHLLSKGHGISSSMPMDLIELYAQANLLHKVTGSFLPGPQAMGGMAGSGPNWGPFDATFGPYFDGTVTLPGGKLPGGKMTAYQMSIWDHETDIPFLRNIAEHFKAKGWFDRLFQYTCDEPRPEPTNACSFNDIKAKANALHQADPALRSLVTTSIQKAEKYGVAGYIDILTPTIRFMDDKWVKSRHSEVPENELMVGNQRAKYAPEVWWYQACGSHGCGIIGGGSDDPNGYHTDWPTYMIDVPSMFNRVMEWQTYKYNVQGLLYFDMVYAFGQKDPWVTQHYFGGNGDGTLYYPGRPNKIGGTKHIPIESIRLKLIREGQEDYEYMHLLKGLGEAAYADAQVATVITNTYTWNREPLDLYGARENMAGRILMHTAPAEAVGVGSDPSTPVDGLPSGVGAGGSIGAVDGQELPGGGGGGGGGCALVSMQERTDWKQAIPYLIVFFSPFTGRLLRKLKRRS